MISSLDNSLSFRYLFCKLGVSLAHLPEAFGCLLKQQKYYFFLKRRFTFLSVSDKDRAENAWIFSVFGWKRDIVRFSFAYKGIPSSDCFLKS